VGEEEKKKEARRNKRGSDSLETPGNRKEEKGKKLEIAHHDQLILAMGVGQDPLPVAAAWPTLELGLAVIMEWFLDAGQRGLGFPKADC
jgi:hypothetical protein